MENEKMVNPKKKTALLVVGLVIVVAVVAALILSTPKGERPSGPDNVANTPGQGDLTSNPGEPGSEGEINPDDMEAIETEVGNPILEGAITQAPGADLITTEGKVVNQEGREVRTDVEYNSPEAPRQTQALEEEDIVEAIKLTVGSGAIQPNEFTVSAGSAVTLALTGTDESSHILAFANPEMSAVYINIRPGETRATTFNAPSTPGEYTYFCDFPGHRGRGEEGKMIVR